MAERDKMEQFLLRSDEPLQKNQEGKLGKGKGREGRERRSQKKGYHSFPFLSVVNFYISLAILWKHILKPELI